LSFIQTDFLYPEPKWPLLVSNLTPVILDVGANDGGTSRMFQHYFPLGRVYAFEPDPRAISHCKQRIEIGHLDPSRFELFEGAVSDETGFCVFFQSDGHDPNWYASGHDLSGSILTPTSERPLGSPDLFFKSTIQVKCITLEDWLLLKGISKIDVLWMDVQGAEARVLKGMKSFVNHMDWIHFEVINSDSNCYVGQATLEEIKVFLPNFRQVAVYTHGNFSDFLFRRIEEV